MAFRNPLIPTQVDEGDLLEIIKNSRSVTMKGTDFSDKPVGTTSSFFYDPPSQGLKSTQQLNVDWSKFENHTFFNSAEVNTNVAFDKMINYFPFDGTRSEVEKFFEKLTGFEKYIYDRFPKNKGYLFFTGSYISVKDNAGSLFPEISKNKTGASVLMPEDSFTIEYQIFVPASANELQIVCQRTSGFDGFTSFVTSSASTQSTMLGLSVTSGSSTTATSASIEKGRFHHIAFVYNKDSGENVVAMYKNGDLVARSTATNINKISIPSSDLMIGSGSLFRIDGTNQLPTQTLVGALDEFRFFHSARTIEQIKENAYKGIFATEDLKLYYKFNEPTGTLGGSENDSINAIVLDSSGNSLHSYITGYSSILRSTGSQAVPMTYEKLSLCPVLFPGYPAVADLNEELLTSGSTYDAVNPNIITKLIPPHYLMRGRAHDGLDSDMGPIGDAYGGTSVPGKGKLGQTQLLLSMLYVWAKFFDEIKLYIDAFAKSEDVDYDPNKSAADHFLPLLFKKWGVKVPSFFVDSTIEQFIDAENLKPVISTDQNSLQYIQNQILRRVLSNLNEIVKAKGTQHSVRSFLRSMGFDPDNSFRIKEYGGPTRRNLSFSRENKTEVGKMLDFVSGGYVQSGFLSSSRVETGFPQVQGTMVLKNLFGPHGISNSIHDGLYTSGSWTVEGIYRYPAGRSLNDLTQSLMRMHVTGDLAGSNPGTVFNLLAISGSSDENHRLVLYGRVSKLTSLTTGPILSLELTGSTLFDGNEWHVSFGRARNDEINSLTSSYYLRAATRNNGEINRLIVTQSYPAEMVNLAITNNILQFSSGSYNASGSFLAIGSASLPLASGISGLNINSSSVNPEVRATNFNGQVSNVRFWTKSFEIDEWKEHVRNPRSTGVENPFSNSAFQTVSTGSWNKLRLDVSMDQSSRDASAAGTINFLDYSQNNKHLVGSNFPASKQVIQPVIRAYSFLSPYFDEGITNEKVRVRSYQSFNKVQETPWAAVAPSYQIDPNEIPMDDPRFSIEFSLIDALNRDIVTIFSALDAIDNAIGEPNLAFGSDYPSLEAIRSMYFNRLTDKINLNRFFDMYRWFDSSISSFVENIVPRKTKYLGSNFVVESHMLERHKKEYFHSDIYVASNDRHSINNVLLLQQISGIIKKH